MYTTSKLKTNNVNNCHYHSITIKTKNKKIKKGNRSLKYVFVNCTKLGVPDRKRYDIHVLLRIYLQDEDASERRRDKEEGTRYPRMMGKSNYSSMS